MAKSSMGKQGSARKSKRNPKGRKTIEALRNGQVGFDAAIPKAQPKLNGSINFVTREATMHNEPTRVKRPPKALREAVAAHDEPKHGKTSRRTHPVRGGKRDDADRRAMQPARSFQTKRKPYSGAQPNREDRPRF